MKIPKILLKKNFTRLPLKNIWIVWQSRLNLIPSNPNKTTKALFNLIVRSSFSCTLLIFSKDGWITVLILLQTAHKMSLIISTNKSIYIFVNVVRQIHTLVSVEI